MTNPEDRKRLIRQLEKNFPDLHIYESKDGSADGYLVYGDKCDDREQPCRCFSLLLGNNEISIEEIKYKRSELCSLSGTSILSGLTETFKEMKIKKVRLADKAKIHFKLDGKIYSIWLAKYNILLYGTSWYNRFGYYSEGYKEEMAHNDQLRHTKISTANQKKIKTLCTDFDPSNKTYYDLIKFIDAGLRYNKNNLCCLRLLELVNDKKFLDIRGYKTTGNLYYDFMLEQSFSDTDSKRSSQSSRETKRRRENSYK
jgi:hypothetical protein